MTLYSNTKRTIVILAYETNENVTEQPYFLRQMESHQPLLTTSGIINPMHYYQSSEHSAVGAVGDDDSTSLDSASMVDQHFQRAMVDGDYDFVCLSITICDIFDVFLVTRFIAR